MTRPFRQLIIEADGGSRGNPGPAAFGAVVLDASNGEILAEVADHLGIATNNVAEYQGLIAGLSAARQIDPAARVEARLDSKLVVQQMSGGWAIKNERLRELAVLARSTMPVEQVRYKWVPRAQNKRADALANRSMDAFESGKSPKIREWKIASPERDSADEAAVGDRLADAGQFGEADLAAAPRIIGWSRADLGTPTTLTLVRHGVTAQSVEHRFSGWRGADPPLIDLGVRQAHATAEELQMRAGGDLILTSPLLRTRQTATILAQTLGLPEPIIVEGLAEASFGAWDSMTYSQVREQSPYELAAWLKSQDVAPPGGESFAQVRSRVLGALAKILARYPRKHVIVVSHVTPIKVLVQSVLAAPPESAFRFELAPCSLTTLAWWADGLSTVFGMGERGHLHGNMHDTA